MDLKTYLEKLSKSERAAFAKAAGTEVSYLPHLAGGHRKPSGRLANKIEIASKGKVKREELRPDIFSRAA